MPVIDIVIHMTVDAAFYVGAPEQAASHLLRCEEVQKLPCQEEDVKSFRVVSAIVKES